LRRTTYPICMLMTLVAIALAPCCRKVDCSKGGTPSPAIRNTAYGQVIGADDATNSGTYYWKGVPFAKAPVGALRWHAPVEPDAWTGR